MRFINCRLRDGKYYAVLSDGSEIEWTVYCSDKADELRAAPRAGGKTMSDPTKDVFEERDALRAENAALREDIAEWEEAHKGRCKDWLFWKGKDEALRAENARLLEEVALQMEHKETFRVENARLKAVNADERIHFDTLYADYKRLRAVLKPLAEAVRVAKEAASYNRHKREHCISQSMWSALCDQEKQARAAMEDE